MDSSIPDYSSVVSATGFLRPRASRSLSTFHDHLLTSRRTLALLGAGLSAPSGIPTYRGAGGLWRSHDVTALCTPAGFAADPALVWSFELERREMIRAAEPNAAHVALAEFAKRKGEGFLALSMNVDDLSERAGHPAEGLWHLHGSAFKVRCSECDEVVAEGVDATERALSPLLSRHATKLPIDYENIPTCPVPECGGLLRPGIVWFTETIPRPLLKSIAEWINDEEKSIDTMLVIGTSALVYPATAYIEGARRKGARVAVVDIEKEDPSLLGLEEQDWYFQGDAVDVVPEMLRPVLDG